MKKLLSISFACMLLFTAAACAPAAQPAQETDAPVVIAASATPTPATTEAPAEVTPTAEYAPLSNVLRRICTDYLPGTAGCSLQAAKLAGELLDWYSQNTPDMAAVTATMRSVVQTLPPNAEAQYGEQFNGVHDAAIELTRDYAADYLESAGYTPVSNVPYASADAAALFDALRTGLDEATAPFLRTVDASMPFTMDIDGDGVQETVTVAVDEDAYTAKLSISGGEKTYAETLDTALMFLTAYIGGAWPGSDGETLFLCGDMASSDYATYIFRVQDGELQHGVIYGVILGASVDGTVTIDAVVDVFGTYGGRCEYRMNDDFTFSLSTPYTIEGMEGTANGRTLTVICDALPVTLQDGTDGAGTLKKGTELMLTETDEDSYAVLMDGQGALYRVDIERTEDDWQWYINGVPEDACFSPLLYAG